MKQIDHSVSEILATMFSFCCLKDNIHSIKLLQKRLCLRQAKNLHSNLLEKEIFQDIDGYYTCRLPTAISDYYTVWRGKKTTIWWSTAKLGKEIRFYISTEITHHGGFPQK